MADNKTYKKKDRDFLEKVRTETVENMKSIGTYKPEFEVIIYRYSEMRLQFSILMKDWYKNGCKITEPYTNKNGATNIRKSAIYLAIENLRKEITQLETIFGLTPSGLKKIHSKSLEKRKESRLLKAINKPNG